MVDLLLKSVRHHIPAFCVTVKSNNLELGSPTSKAVRLVSIENERRASVYVPNKCVEH